MRETPRAQAAFNDYLAMGPNRSLEKLLALYREQSGSENSVPTLRMSTLTGWSVAHAWQQRLADIAEAERQAIVARGIADRIERVKSQNDRWQRMQRVIEAREVRHPESDYAAAGADSGLMVLTVRHLPGGGRTEEWAVDTGLLRELRELEKQAAQELGQWTEKKDITSDGKALTNATVIVLPDNGRGDRTE